MVQGKFFGSPHLVAPVLTKMCGTFLAFTYLWIAVLVGVPSVPDEEQHLFLLDQLAHLLDRAWRTVAVVQADEVDLAAVDPALIVDHLEVGGLGRPMVP